MVVQRITSCSKKNGNLFFFQKKEKKRKKKEKKREKSHFKKKKKTFFFKIQFSWTTSWPDPLWKRYVGSLAKARSHSPNQPWRIKSKQCDKIVWVHVRLSSFVLHQACLNLGHWPIYIVCEYVLLIWKNVFIWGINPFFCKHVYTNGNGQKCFHDNWFLIS